jgi:hypothetical protein
MQLQHLCSALSCLLIFSAVHSSESAYAFNLKKMMETVAPPQSSNDSETDKPLKGREIKGDSSGSSLGGLFGGKKPGGLLGAGGKFGNLPGSGGNASSGGSDQYQGSTILRLACDGPKKISALYGGASKSSLDQWSDRVLQDIGVTPGTSGRSNILAIMNPVDAEFNGLKWAELVRFYSGSFISKKIKIEIELWEGSREERLNIAGRLRKATNDPNLDDEDRADAKFAYALVLAHFAGELKSNDTVEAYLKSAWREGSIGAMYVRGYRMYKGLSYPKDVNGASNFVYAAFQRVQEIREKAEEELEAPPDLWDEPEKLWTLFATDPAYEGHKRFQSLAAAAAQIRGSVQKEIDKGAKGALSKKIKRLTTIRRNSEMLIAKAFGYGKKLAVENKSIEDLKNKADGNSQVIKKIVSIEDDSSGKLFKYIANNEQKLGPEGLKLATKAKQGAVYVATESFKMATNTFTLAPGSGSFFGGAVAGLKAAERARNLSCQLNEAIVTYTDKKSLKLDARDLNTDPDVMKELSQEDAAS